MDFISRIRSHLSDARFDANLIAIYGLIVAVVIASLVLRRLVGSGATPWTTWKGLGWLESIRSEAHRKARAVLFWLTAAAVLVIAAFGAAYHVAGRDIRSDVSAWSARLSFQDFIQAGANLMAVLGIFITSWATLKFLRRLRVSLAHHIAQIPDYANDKLVRQWLVLAERFGSAAIRLAALWAAARITGLTWASLACVFALQLVAIAMAARLSTIGFRILGKIALVQGDRYLKQKHIVRYWERLRRLLPFAERCFEAAVYVYAASCSVGVLNFITVVAQLGPQLVKCIGIIFTTRVLIEFLQVLLNEAFGLYEEDAEPDQKGRTLVPLLYSVCWYVLYFGAALLIMQELGQDTKPILAGAGILGIAVGLGAQSLVSDVVSGFFILFENQYLVGDYVQIGDAVGLVEAIGIRVTQIRDDQGKLYIIPNGQIKAVVNYSKGYVNAVVDIRTPSGTDLESVFRAMTEAGRRLRQTHKQVLADTEIRGLVELTTSDMTVRAVTKVKPGTHVAMQNEYRRLLKLTLDQTPLAPRASHAA